MNVINEIKKEALDTLGNAAFTSRFWLDVKMFVEDAEGQAGLTGQQKKDKVRRDLLVVFEDVAEWVLNLAIELAVAYLKVL